MTINAHWDRLKVHQADNDVRISPSKMTASLLGSGGLPDTIGRKQMVWPWWQ